jgi:carboxymethylenebutenolidase
VLAPLVQQVDVVRALVGGRVRAGLEVHAQALLGALVLAWAAGCAAPAPVASSSGVGAATPIAVQFPSGSLRLHGLLWKPDGPGPFPAVLFSHGSGGANADETAGLPITEAAARLAPLFTARGYAFFHPFRRGQGPSADAAPFLQERLAREERAHGREARQQLQDTLLRTEQLDDVLAALSFLERTDGIDPSRVVLMGNSFGGQLTLLVAAREPTIRAAVTFAAAAGSWSRSEEVRRLLSDAVGRAACPIMLVQWRNDFSIEASLALGQVRGGAGQAPLVVLYPPVGSKPGDGHNGLYLATAQWEPDVFRFLAQALAR